VIKKYLISRIFCLNYIFKFSYLKIYRV